MDPHGLHRQLIWIIHGFCICELVSLLNLACNPLSVVMAPWWSFRDMHRVVKNLSGPICILSWGWSGRGSASLCLLPHCKQRSFHGLFSVMFFALLCSLLISVFKMAQVLKCCLVVQTRGGWDVPPRENARVRSASFRHKLQSCWPVRSMRIKQQCILRFFKQKQVKQVSVLFDWWKRYDQRLIGT